MFLGDPNTSEDLTNKDLATRVAELEARLKKLETLTGYLKWGVVLISGWLLYKETK